MLPLRTIVYVSTASHLMTNDELEWLLQESRALNQESGVTGLLLYGAGSFMQCFEGPDAAVEETWRRIRASRRHADIRELLDERIAVRHFDGWSMAFHRSAPPDWARLTSGVWRGTSSDSYDAREVPAGLALLRQFWDTLR